MENLYEMLLGRPRPANHADANADTDAGVDAGANAAGQPFGWDVADGAGPDRLFNRYRRLRLTACTEPTVPVATARCPAAPTAGRA